MFARSYGRLRWCQNMNEWVSDLRFIPPSHTPTLGALSLLQVGVWSMWRIVQNTKQSPLPMIDTWDPSLDCHYNTTEQEIYSWMLLSMRPSGSLMSTFEASQFSQLALGPHEMRESAIESNFLQSRFSREQNNSRREVQNFQNIFFHVPVTIIAIMYT